LLLSFALLWGSPAHADDYEARKSSALAMRDRLAEELDLGADDIALTTRAAFADAVLELLPPWEGTAWAMNGTTEIPNEGSIACGYFVSTVLRDAGLQVERVTLAQQGAESIIRTLSDDEDIRRYRNTPVHEVLRDHEEPGVYIVGLDWHVGILVVAAGEPTFCHASRSQNQRVLCEPAATSRALRSRYTVVGRLSDRVHDAWLSETLLPTEHSAARP
jgi:hypothetical protein